MSNRLDEIKARLEAATKGPWRCFENAVYGKASTAIDPMICDIYRPNDNDLIANAPSDIAYLLEENERFREAILQTDKFLREVLKDRWGIFQIWMFNELNETARQTIYGKDGGQ